jgi:cell volume regulation protein A
LTATSESGGKELKGEQGLLKGLFLLVWAIWDDGSMPTPIALYLTILGALLAVGVMVSRTSARFGIPLLLAFLSIGILAGENGIARISFSNYQLSFDIGVTALVLILFDGGFNTPVSRVRSAVLPSLLHATLGVAASAALIGLFVHLLFTFNWAESLLVGSIVSSTDSAAVFSILGHAGIQLKRRVALILELESGLNDPMAVLLVSILTRSLAENQPIEILPAALEIMYALSLGVFAGVLFGWISGKLMRIASPPATALLPVLSIAIAFLTFGTTTLIGGSGFAAVYICGAILGNADIPFHSGIRRVHDSVTWLAQLLMFMLLGLLLTPVAAAHMALPGLAVALLSALVARPVLALVCLIPLRLKLNEILYIGLVGLRGATPIILAIYPVVARVRHGQEIFDLIFLAVVVNSLFPTMSVSYLTAKLGIGSDEPPRPPAILEILSSRVLKGAELLAFHDRACLSCHRRVATRYSHPARIVDTLGDPGRPHHPASRRPDAESGGSRLHSMRAGR